MGALAIEFSKLRRKNVWLVCLGAAALCLVWVSADVARTAQGSPDGTASMLYAAPLVNSIVLTLFAAVISSRVCEVDHKAQALKELLCAQRAGSLFAAKLACSLVLITATVVLETAGLAALASYKGFTDQLGIAGLAAFAACQVGPAFTVAAIVQAIALRWENQFASLALGLALSLAGLFSLFFPPAVQRLVPSGYFGLLSCVNMDWDGTAHTTSFHTVPFAWPDAALLAAICGVVIAVSAVWFSRKEL
ncbi:ABC transporter permease [Curtanaerobium respiraculi]|uniref:ABC transporter permease n=1 Tax=Curtanaerobium respiraculi TaxID=2949669 RepID=UPI0024B35B49|nr:ABC transporter permease [Curtanaerobium respiraculi]